MFTKLKLVGLIILAIINPSSLRSEIRGETTYQYALPEVATKPVQLQAISPRVSIDVVYHLHPYPICFYDTDLGAVNAARSAWRTIPATLEAVVNAKKRRKTTITFGSSTRAFIKTTMNHHRELLNIWPEIACIGRTGGISSQKANKICRRYVEDFIRREIDHKITPSDVIEPICQTFLPEN